MMFMARIFKDVDISDIRESEIVGLLAELDDLPGREQSLIGKLLDSILPQSPIGMDELDPE